jgi:glycerophosphoryl diester phosphodiesterase
MYNTFTESYLEIKRNIIPYITYELLFKLLSLMVLGPVIGLVGAYFIAFTGHSSVSNQQLLTYVLSVPGIASVFLWGMAGFAVFFMEIAGLVTIAWSSLNNRPITATMAFLTALRNTQGLLGVGMIQLLIYSATSVPFLCAAALTYYGLLTEHDISYYLAYKPPEFILAAAIGVLLILGLCLSFYYLFTGWVFSIHTFLFERKTWFEALQRSRGLVKGAFSEIGRSVASIVLLFLAISSLAAAALAVAGGAAVYGLGRLLNAPVLLAAVVLTANVVGAAILSLLVYPFASVVVTRFYCRQYERQRSTTLQTAGKSDDANLIVPKPGRVSRIAAWSAVALFIVSTGVVSMSIHEELAKGDKVEVTAHRGSSARAPENTLSAIKAAIEDGADFAEIDVQETSDGVVVLLHDSDLKKVTGMAKKIWEASYEEIKDLDAGSWFSPEFQGEKIPTLEDAINTAFGKIKLNIELKYNGHDKKLAQRVVGIVQGRRFEEHCILTSLDLEGLEKVKSINPKLRTGYILVKGIGDIAGLNVDLFSVQSSIATYDFVGSVHKQKKQVHVWTVNSRRNMEYFIDLRVDNIITDHPLLLVNLLKERAYMDDPELILRKLRNWLRQD